VVRPSLGVKTIPELLAVGKRQRLSYATFGAGTTPHMAMETFKTETGLEATHVPYRGESQGLQDLLGGSMDMMFGTMSTMLPHVEQGKLVGLAVGTTNRSVIAPHIPTVREILKLQRFNFDSWFCLMAPSATPPDRINTLSSAFKTVLKRPAIQEALLKRGIEPIQGADDVAAFIDANIKEYAEVIRRSKITLD
jgi:tripartite-type tricarboxylate transporter receptor subunit TctC